MLKRNMGTADSGNGLSSTFSFPKWIFLSVLFLLQTGVQHAGGMTCYAAAQISCYQNLTVLVVMMQKREEISDKATDICGAFYAVQDCLIPHLADCDRVEQDLFMEDIVNYMQQPPYQCKNNREKIHVQPKKGIDGLGRNGSSQIHGQSFLSICSVIILIGHMMNTLSTRQKS